MTLINRNDVTDLTFWMKSIDEFRILNFSRSIPVKNIENSVELCSVCREFCKLTSKNMRQRDNELIKKERTNEGNVKQKTKRKGKANIQAEGTSKMLFTDKVQR